MVMALTRQPPAQSRTANFIFSGVALDSTGDAYITGTAGSDFPTTTGAFQTTYGGGSQDAVVAEVNPAGSAFVYATYLGGPGNDQGTGIAIDPSGNAYVTGSTSSSSFPTTSGAFQTTYGGNGDAFVTELNPSGSGLLYSTYLGGADHDSGSAIAVSSGAIVVEGETGAPPGGADTATFPDDPGSHSNGRRRIIYQQVQL
jgi:hypothetical protein